MGKSLPMSSLLLRLGVLAAVTVVSHSFAGPAKADDDDVVSQMSAGRIERIVKSFSDVSNFKERGNNAYYFEITGLKVLLYNQGESLQLSAYFTDKVSLSQINEWNRRKRFSRAYLDKDNDPVVESDLELTGGVTEANVKEWIKTYYVSLKAFKAHLSE